MCTSKSSGFCKSLFVSNFDFPQSDGAGNGTFGESFAAMKDCFEIPFITGGGGGLSDEEFHMVT